MAEHPNVLTTRAAHEAFSKGDKAIMAALLADDIVWHAPGNNPYSGDAVGKGASLERLGRLAQDGATISFEIHDIVGNDEHVVVLADATISKGSSSSVGRQVQVLHVRDGKWAEVWVSNEDQAAFDAVLNS
jgi:uncharacterized protein